MIRIIRRPPYPDELRHEFVWPCVLFSGAAFSWAWFRLGGSLPECLFMKWAGLPCLGCGGTRSARCLVALDPVQGFLYHPGFTVVAFGLSLWTLYSAYVWISRDPLRLRLAMDEGGRALFRRALLAALVAHWAWQVFYLV